MHNEHSVNPAAADEPLDADPAFSGLTEEVRAVMDWRLGQIRLDVRWLSLPMTSRLVSLMVPLLIGSLAHMPDMMAAAVGSATPRQVMPADSVGVQPDARLYPLLQTSWQAYRQAFIQGDGRVIDHKQLSLTTSEGQSYALLRAVWMDDRGTFDRVWDWTRNNLRVRGDRLLAWKWGQYLPERNDKNPNQLPPGGWGVLDNTSASDADQDVALALLMAHQRWVNPAYQREALEILADFWQKLTLESPGGLRVLLPGDWYQPGQWPDEVTLNPSYFAPYAYRVFAQADPSRPWLQLISTGYQQLYRIQQASPTGLMPDWITWNQRADSYHWLGVDDAKERRGDFGYDAFRLMWRLQLDSVLFGDRRPMELMRPSTEWLRRFWQERGRLPGPITPQGQEREVLDSEAIYGALFPVLASADPRLGQTLEQYWVNGHRSDQGLWLPVVDYYAQNWYWFGVLLAHRQQCPPVGRATTPLIRLTDLASLQKAK